VITDQVVHQEENEVEQKESCVMIPFFDLQEGGKLTCGLKREKMGCKSSLPENAMQGAPMCIEAQSSNSTDVVSHCNFLLERQIKKTFVSVINGVLQCGLDGVKIKFQLNGIMI